ncbi:hypothetical protein PFMC_01252 [Plasmodium falciparum CAMP/Malaysia]|uniref:Uncharacterized protein n=1 Tax=Plasmodium falciparum (isolate Camp / Malaysia) TaxID=5835 RepID=A0A024XBS6_PLAFC|nr:hypothetical protein PFMC_01252 [Plasmodium falciparum CAMP/Malaysia]
MKKKQNKMDLLKCKEKLYNNFYVKGEIYFPNLSDKSNDKSCECANKKKIYNHLSSSNKVHDNYLDNLKTVCAEVLGTCTLSSVVTGSYGASSTATAVKTLLTISYTTIATEL